MKYKLLFIVIVLLAVASCKKDSTPALPQRPLIKEFVHNIPNVGAPKREYTYNGQKVNTETFYGSLFEYEYYNDKVITNVRRSNGSFLYREIAELDNNGYVNKKYQSLSNGIIYYYKVKPDGFLESEYHMENNIEFEYKHHYDKTGLLDSTYLFSNGLLTSITVYTEYDLDKTYTCENENFGKIYLGKKFIHPPLKYKVVNLNSQFVGQGSSVYTYDDQGRVIKDVRTINNSIDHTDTYVYY